MTIFDKNYDKFGGNIWSNFCLRNGPKIDPKIGPNFSYFRGQKWPPK